MSALGIPVKVKGLGKSNGGGGGGGEGGGGTRVVPSQKLVPSLKNDEQVRRVIHCLNA